LPVGAIVDVEGTVVVVELAVVVVVGGATVDVPGWVVDGLTIDVEDVVDSEVSPGLHARIRTTMIRASLFTAGQTKRPADDEPAQRISNRDVIQARLKTKRPLTTNPHSASLIATSYRLD